MLKMRRLQAREETPTFKSGYEPAPHFYHFILSGKLDVEILLLYKSAIIKADALLSLFVSEKEKRVEFTYKILPDANKIPAKESLDNATKFLTNIRKIALL